MKDKKACQVTIRLSTSRQKGRQTGRHTGRHTVRGSLALQARDTGKQKNNPPPHRLVIGCYVLPLTLA